MGAQRSIAGKAPGAERPPGSLAEPVPSAGRLPGNDILGLQQTIGNRRVAHLLGARRVQPKLRVGPADDVYEQEADRMADAVARGGGMPAVSASPAPAAGIQRLCAECAEEEEKELRRKPSSGGSSPVEFAASEMPRGGAPLAVPVRRAMEPFFGRDFSRVRIHTGERAASAADKVRARAFTLGEDIVFAAGEYRPKTAAGQNLLAHELTHVVQQTGGSAETGVQRLVDESSAPAESSTAAGPSADSAAQQPEPAPAAPRAPGDTGPEAEAGAQSLLVDDSSAAPGPAQMKKSEFLDALRASVTAAADAEMAGTGQTTADCPWIDYWFGYYGGQDASHTERAIRRFAPESAGARTAADYIPAVTARVRRGVALWVRTGEVPELPDMGTSDSAGAAAGGERIAFKARSGGAANPRSPAAVRAQLGRGQPLEGGLRARMESAFGVSFSHVQAHTDHRASRLSAQMNARAFAVGEHVAFAAGEYRPGTPAGDALIAHELAHIVQQHGAARGEHGSAALERDADTSAVGVVASLWSGARRGLAEIGRNAMPRLRSGLRLQMCKSGSTSTSGTGAGGAATLNYTPGTASNLGCGGYDWPTTWSLNGASASTNGFIVQKLTFRNRVERCAGGRDDFDKTYWEAWQVRAGSIFVGTSDSPHHADTFSSPPSPSKKGVNYEEGYAKYIEGYTAPLHWGNVPEALSLPSTESEPAGWTNAGTEHRYIQNDFDCCDGHTRSDLTTG